MNPRIIHLVLQIKNCVQPALPLLEEIRLLLVEDGEEDAADQIALAISSLSSAVFSLTNVSIANG